MKVKRINTLINDIVMLAGSIDASYDNEDQKKLNKMINDLKKLIKKTQSDYENKISEIRTAFADYTQTEGCSCCRDIDGHTINAERLAKLLNVEPYNDNSGYDFSKYRSGK